MQHAEDVTFGGSGLDRAAELRGNVDAQAHTQDDTLASGTGGHAVVIWRGKPLVTGGDGSDALASEPMALVRVPLDHPLLKDAAPDLILLGRDGPEGAQAGGQVGDKGLDADDAALCWAVDLSPWSPADLDAAQMNGFLDPTEQVHPAMPQARFAELRGIMTHLSPRDAELAATAKAVQGWHASHGFCARCGAASVPVQSGWQRSCPSCGAQHFPRTDPVVIMLITHGNDCLLGRSPGWPEGMYSCLAGFVEPGETVEAAVRREVVEESGVRVGPVRYLASQPWAFPASLMLGCAGIATTRDITLDPNELEDARWVSREEIAAAMVGQSDWLKPARKGAIAHFLLENWLADRLD